jgi:hypothetical protein
MLRHRRAVILSVMTAVEENLNSFYGEVVVSTIVSIVKLIG